MESKLAKYFRDERTARGLSVTQLAERAGYPDIRNRAILIERFEYCGTVNQKMVPRLAAALEIPPAVLLKFMLDDWLDFMGEWFIWATAPWRAVIGFGHLMGQDRSFLSSEDCRTLETVESYAAAWTQKRHHSAKLFLNNRFQLEIDKNGIVTRYCEVVPAPWIWQAESREERAVTRERFATAFASPPDSPAPEQPSTGL